MQHEKRTIVILLLSLCIFQSVYCAHATDANGDLSSAISRVLKQKDILAVRQTFRQLFDWTADLRNKNTSKPFFGSLCKNWVTQDAVYEFVDFATFTGCNEIRSKWYNHTRRAYSFLKQHVSNDEIEVNGNTSKAYFYTFVTAVEKKKARWMQLDYEVEFVKEGTSTEHTTEQHETESHEEGESSAVHEQSSEDIQFASANEIQPTIATEFPNPGGWKVKHLKANFGFVSKFYKSWLETKQPTWSTVTNNFVYKDKEAD